MPSGQETRVVDPITGGVKGSKLQRMDLLPWDALLAVAEHFGYGAWKYDERNWEKGYKWSLSFAALERHLAEWWSGEEFDVEELVTPSGETVRVEMPHLRAAAWHALVLLAFAIRGIGTDDRP